MLWVMMQRCALGSSRDLDVPLCRALHDGLRVCQQFGNRVLISHVCSCPQTGFSGPTGGAVVPFVSVSATLEKSIRFICGATRLIRDSLSQYMRIVHT